MMNRNPIHQQANPEMNATQGPLRAACQICGRNNHNALDCYHLMDYSFQRRHPPGELAAMVAQLNEEFGAQKWLVDSGANAHVTADAANIQNPQPFEGTDVVGWAMEQVCTSKTLVLLLFIPTLLIIIHYFLKISYIAPEPQLIYFPSINSALTITADLH
jgi:hypothetical protein